MRRARSFQSTGQPDGRTCCLIMLLDTESTLTDLPIRALVLRDMRRAPAWWVEVVCCGSFVFTRPVGRYDVRLRIPARQDQDSQIMSADQANTERYNPKDVEPRWRATWEANRLFHTRNDDTRPPYYVLEMFPYPSGRIHMGHVRNYTMGDVVARYKRAKGFNVLHPMGWDAFGMPAENAAMENKVHPAQWTYANIAAMRKQLQSMGLSLDWSREFATCDPSYYKHQQKLFLDFLKAGLVDRKTAKVNWDPVDHTVLANEQVIDGRGWRSGALVEQRELTQWFLRITDYAEDLNDALDGLDRWPEKVRLMQRNWIGRSEGLALRFALDPASLPENGELPGFGDIEVYTTRPDTLFGARFLALSADHPLAKALARDNAALSAFIDECHHMGTAAEALEKAEKKGFDTGLAVIHPFDPDWKLPVYVANFVLMDYGTGAVFGCPAHDQRDLDFSNAYGLGNTPVVCPPGVDPATFTVTDTAFTDDGVLINSRFLDGMSIAQAKEEVAARLETQERDGRPVAVRKVNFRLRDWGISRQRYWGCPIPIIHCESCGPVPVPDEDLPVKLPEDVTFDQPGNPWTVTTAGSRCPARNVAAPLAARPIRWTRSSIRRGTSPASPTRRTKPRQPTPPPPTTGCRWISTSAASSTQFSTCSIPASSAAPWRQRDISQ